MGTSEDGVGVVGQGVTSACHSSFVFELWSMCFLSHCLVGQLGLEALEGVPGLGLGGKGRGQARAARSQGYGRLGCCSGTLQILRVIACRCNWGKLQNEN